MDLADIRRLVIVSMFSDDALYERLVLKGGNAISLVYRYGARSSLDVDFSIDGDFEDIEDATRRILAALTDRFRVAGYVLFDYSFAPRPSTAQKGGNRWGGYRVQFKIIEREKYDQLNSNLDAARRNATVIGPMQKRIFTIDLSKYEFCVGKASTELQDYEIYVYTPLMLVLEKVRAICQQMPEYEPRIEKAARARDFYDIHVLVEEGGVHLASAEASDLARQIFAAKDVPVELIGNIGKYREFHRQDWPSVQDAVGGALEAFDFYFDFVLKELRSLEPLWNK